MFFSDHAVSSVYSSPAGASVSAPPSPVAFDVSGGRCRSLPFIRILQLSVLEPPCMAPCPFSWCDVPCRRRGILWGSFSPWSFACRGTRLYSCVDDLRVFTHKSLSCCLLISTAKTHVKWVKMIPLSGVLSHHISCDTFAFSLSFSVSSLSI